MLYSYTIKLFLCKCLPFIIVLQPVTAAVKHIVRDLH